MTDVYDRHHVDSVLRHAGVPEDQRIQILARVEFPISLNEVLALLAPFGLTHDSLVDRMGGSP